jgi:hypothetical protein
MHVVGTFIDDIYMIATGIGTIDVNQAIAGARFNEPLPSFVEQFNQPGMIGSIAGCIQIFGSHLFVAPKNCR